MSEIEKKDVGLLPKEPDVETQEPTAIAELEEQNNPLITEMVDLTRANVRFTFLDSLRPKDPKKSNRARLELPVYSPRVQLAALEHYLDENFEIALRKTLNDEPLNDDERRVYNSTMATSLHPRGDWGDRALTREGSEWTNQPLAPNGVTYIRPALPPADEDDKDSNPDAPISGDMAIYHAIRATQSGSPATIPLWHAGFWLKQNPPANDRVALMHERIAADKIIGGRESGGYAFSATSVVTRIHAIEMALECCYQANVNTKTTQELMEIIPVTDQPAILMNTLISMYPYGYPYVQYCLANPETCNYRVEDVISFARIWQVDNSMITKRMREIIYDSSVILTPELLAEYKSELRVSASRHLDLMGNGRAIIELEVPSIAKNNRAGRRWLTDVAGQLKDILSSPNLDADGRERVLQEHQFYSWMRQYEAWVKNIFIEVKGQKRRVAEDDIPTILAQWSRDDDLRDRYIEGIMQFIADSTIALTAIPAWKCPKCQKEIPDDMRDPKYYDLIPLDVAQLFFTLNSARLLTENRDIVL